MPTELTTIRTKLDILLAQFEKIGNGTGLPDVTKDDFVKLKKVDVLRTEYQTKIKTSFPAVIAFLKGLISRSNTSAWVEL